MSTLLAIIMAAAGNAGFPNGPAPEPPWASTDLFNLKFEGTNGSSVFTNDGTGGTLTGGHTLSNARFSEGASSCLLGDLQQLTAGTPVLRADIEGDSYYAFDLYVEDLDIGAINVLNCVLSAAPGAWAGPNMTIIGNGDGTANILFSWGSTGIATVPNFPTNSFRSVAFVSTSGTCSLYVGGQFIASIATPAVPGVGTVTEANFFLRSASGVSANVDRFRFAVPV